MNEDTQRPAEDQPAVTVYEDHGGQDISEASTLNTREPLAARLRRLLFGANHTGDRGGERLADLSAAIEAAPDAAANYVLRGELYQKAGQYDLAADDFRRAVDITVGDLDRADWGLVAQALRDRALAGLEQAERLRQRAHEHAPRQTEP